MAAAVLSLLPAVIEAIFVSPTAVFMTHRSPSAQVTVGNTGDRPEEAEIELQFGFPDTDSTGTPFVRLIEFPGPQFPSAAAWIRPFPRRVRLEPGDRQVVRLLATPPADLPDGEYWSRMIVTGRGASLPIVSTDSAVQAGVSLEIRLVTSIVFRKGTVTTGITVSDLTAEPTGDSLVVWARFTRLGTGAYLGTATFEAVNAGGVTERSWPSVMAVYYPQHRRFNLPLGGLAAGQYRLRLTLTSERSDLDRGQALPAPTVTDSVAFAVP
ncbi:MAG TPA: hypothetical protein VD793_09615 [Gemmatimonadales bacterium]|nr:hypothetical protein [Gemmatimonadales bacterium]